jgi:hypothetical protein
VQVLATSQLDQVMTVNQSPSGVKWLLRYSLRQDKQQQKQTQPVI